MGRSRRSKKYGGPGRAMLTSMSSMESMIESGRINRAPSCSAKIAYSAGAAVDARRAMKRKRKNVAIYHCRFCGNYHLTSIV